MAASLLRLSVVALLLGTASAASADVCVSIDESRDAFAPRDREAALLLVSLQFEREGERVVPAGCANPFVIVHARLGTLVVVTMTGQGRTWQATALTTADLPAVYSQMVRSIVTGRPMTGLNVTDRTNVTATQAQPRRVHSDTLWYGRLGYGAVFGGRAYATPAIGFGYRAELDAFAIDVAFLNQQFSSPGRYLSAGASASSLLKLSGLRFHDPESDRSVYYGAGLSYGFRSIRPASDPSTMGSYRSSWTGSGLQGELTAGYELARATSLRVFVQADAVFPFYPVTSEHVSRTGVTTDRKYVPSLVVSIGLGL